MPNTKTTNVYRNLISSWMIDACDHFWLHRKELVTDDHIFDYPDYGGLPKRCSMKLSSGTVDWIQDNAPFKGMTKKKFAKSFIGLCLFEY